MRRILVMGALVLLVLLGGAFSPGNAAEPLPPGEVSPSRIPGVETAHQTLQSDFSFYIYRPAFLSSPWYLTLEGFPVVQLPNGVWVFGFSPDPAHPEVCYVTGFAVGSVSPVRLGLAPLAPPYIFPQEKGYFSPAMGGVPGRAASPRQVPAWIRDSMFLDIAARKDVVDRVGILTSLSLPVAWKGECPEVVFVWVGKDWYHLKVRFSEGLEQALDRERYTLVRLANRNALMWSDWDTSLLASHTISWGYFWMGRVPW